MNYCDLNPKLFEPFTSVKKKIIPAFADDWEIQPESYNTSAGFGLYSKKLDQYVQDINLRRFLRFCKEQNLSISGLKLNDNLIIGSDRSVYTEEMYNQWLAKYKPRLDESESIGEYIPGWVYQTICGKAVLYLGSKYCISVKYGNYNQIDDIPIPKKSTKKYITSLYLGNKDEHDQYIKKEASENFWLKYETKKPKFIKQIQKLYSLEEVDSILDYDYRNTKSLVYFDNNPAKDLSCFEFKPCDGPSCFYKSKTYISRDGSHIQNKDSRIFESSNWDYKKYTIGFEASAYNTIYNEKMLFRDLEYEKTSGLHSWGYNANPKRHHVIEEFYKLVLVPPKETK